MEEKPAGQDATNTPKEKISGSVKADSKDSTDELCDLSLEDDLLLLREEEEEDFGMYCGKRGKSYREDGKARVWGWWRN